MRTVIIFGTGMMADEAFAILSYLPQYKVIAFTDNDKSKWNKNKESLRILPLELVYEETEALVVIASSYYADIAKQLQEQVPKVKYVESIQNIIGKLLPEERNFLIEKLSGKLQCYNLNYTYKENEEAKGAEDISKKYLVIYGSRYQTTDSNYIGGAFVHRRVLQYLKEGLKVEVFAYIENESLEIYECDGVKVYQGGMLELFELLQRKNYEKLLIHFLQKNIMYAVWKSGKMSMPMIVWCHGYEVMPWNAYFFCYTSEEIKENLERWNQRDKEKCSFLQEMFSKKNIKFIFISGWLKTRVMKYVGLLPLYYEVIPNFIDSVYYKTSFKCENDRKKILSIKSHETKVYANDITAKAIIELSKRDFFSKLEFELYGDGKLFDVNFNELKKCNFENVHIHKQYVKQEEMRRLFSENGIALMPTRRDTQGVTACEAMSAGLVVISCNTAAVPEFIDENCGSLYEFDNYFMVADEIEYLYYHPNEYISKSRQAVIRANEQCGYDATIKCELKLIEQK